MKLYFGLALSLLVAQQAQAHAKLVSANPPIEGVAQGSPRNIDLLFNEAISAKLSGAVVQGPDGKPVAADTMPEKNGLGLMVMPQQPLRPGVYTVDWHAVASDDGHRTTGTYRFTVR
jgi:copper resistance protein C